MTEIPKISLEHSGLKNADSQIVSESYKQLMEQAIQQGLNLTKLDEIIICEDFRSRIFSFQDNVGLPQEITSEPEYLAAGKVIWYPRPEGDMRAKIFINAGLVPQLDESEPPTINVPAIHLLVHELGHVHDDTYITEQFGSIDLHILGNPELISLYLSRCIWGEYHAEFIALTVDTEGGLEANLRSLRSIQDATVSIVTSAHNQYQVDKDTPRLWSTIVTQSSIHLQAIGRIAPYIHCLPPGVQRESMKDLFGIFSSISYGLIDELENLRSHFRQWDTWSWSRLEKSVDDMWQLCGVKPEAFNLGCYVHVLVPPSQLFR